MAHPKTRQPVEPIETGQMALTADERVICARLIRVRRSEGYWLRYFVEMLLHIDANSSDGVSPKQAAEALQIMDNVTRWERYFSEVSKTNPALKDFPGLDWIPWGRQDEDAPSITADVSGALTQQEQLEDELRELRALIASPRGSFRPEAAEYAERLGKALDRMAKENPEDRD